MSLINKRSLALIGAVVLAVGVPIQLLASEKHKFIFPIALPATQLPEPTSFSLAFALASPPFDPDRNPDTSEAPAPVTDEQPAAGPVPALVGVITSRRGRSVALAKTSSGETLTLAPGEAADGWNLVSVDRDSVIFERGGARHTARLDFSNKTAGTNPAAVQSTNSADSRQVALPQTTPSLGGTSSDGEIQ